MRNSTIAYERWAIPARRLTCEGGLLRYWKLLQDGLAVSNRISALVLYAALTLPPLFFGSRSSFAVCLWCAVLGFGLIVSSTARLLRGHLLALAAIGIICTAYGIVIWLQLTPDPVVASPNPVWKAAAEALNQPLPGYVSAVSEEPYFALGPPFANILALTLGLIVGNNSERARRGIRCFAYAGAAYALYGIFAHLIDPSYILWREKTQYAESLTSTFVNRNTAAIYFGSTGSVWLVLLLEELGRGFSRVRRGSMTLPAYVLASISRKAVLRLVMLILCVSALSATNSRAGVLLSFVVFGAALIIDQGKLTLKNVAVAAACFALASGLLLMTIGGGIHHRLTLQGLFDDEGRFAVYGSIIDMIRDHPWLGTGLGTFSSAFPAYRNRDISAQLIWDLGHNTYLELAAEAGLPLTALVGLGWLVAIGMIIKSLLKGRSSIALSALYVSVLALLHSAIDFSLQISGYSIVVFGVLGLGLSQSIRKLTASPAERRPPAFGEPCRSE